MEFIIIPDVIQNKTTQDSFERTPKISDNEVILN